jgi:hypothetical protein
MELPNANKPGALQRWLLNIYTHISVSLFVLYPNTSNGFVPCLPLEAREQGMEAGESGSWTLG